MEEEINSEIKKEKINQTQFFDFIKGEELNWQSIIYDLVKTEQLDPWDIQIGVLADKYVEVIQQLEEADFFISSKVLLACALLLRLKSEILINKYIQDMDNALYGKKEEHKYIFEKIEINEDELPILVPRTPMARHRKVTLKELMSALNQAIDTETRRIKKEIKGKQAEKSALVVLPKSSRIPLKTRIKDIFSKVKSHLEKPENNEMKLSELVTTWDEILASFVPILHLANNEKLHLFQEAHYDDIYITLQRHPKEVEILKRELKILEEPEILDDANGEFIEELKE